MVDGLVEHVDGFVAIDDFPGPPIRYWIRSDLVGSNQPTKFGRILIISNDIQASEFDIYSGCRIPMKDGVSNYRHGYSKKC
jgi:hypothetical protein